jgi:hypothetical protein
VADFLRVALLPFAVVDLAEAAHRLNDTPAGTGRRTATNLAPNLLIAADEIASAARLPRLSESGTRYSTARRTCPALSPERALVRFAPLEERGPMAMASIERTRRPIRPHVQRGVGAT